MNASHHGDRNQTYYPLLKQPAYIVAIFSLAYGLVFLFAFFGNLMVIIVVVRNKSMHTVTNYFIVNLAVSDLLVAFFCVPVTLVANLFNVVMSAATDILLAQSPKTESIPKTSVATIIRSWI